MSDTRRDILDAAIELVRERGVRAVSFREVARRAGVSHQAPYHHFGNHLGVLQALASEGFGTLADAMEAAAAAHPDPLDALVAAGVAYVDFARSHEGHFRVMFDRSLREPPDAPPPADALRTRGVVVALAARAHAAGHAPDLTPAVLADLCWSTAHGVATLCLDGLLGPADPHHPRPDDVHVHIVAGLGAVLRR